MNTKQQESLSESALFSSANMASPFLTACSALMLVQGSLLGQFFQMLPSDPKWHRYKEVCPNNIWNPIAFYLYSVLPTTLYTFECAIELGVLEVRISFLLL